MEMQLKSVCLEVQKDVNCKNMETNFGFMREKFNDFCDSEKPALRKNVIFCKKNNQKINCQYFAKNALFLATHC